MTNYYGNIISKHRPFICVNVKKINGIKYYYFISGTSKRIKDIKVKQFLNYFINIKKSEINNLVYDTNFQCNTIYVFSENDAENFFINFIGKLSTSDVLKINDMFYKVVDNKLWSLSFYSLHWYILDVGINFLYIASRHKKKKNKLRIIIGNNIQNGKKYSKKEKDINVSRIKLFYEGLI